MTDPGKTVGIGQTPGDITKPSDNKALGTRHYAQTGSIDIDCLVKVICKRASCFCMMVLQTRVRILDM
jgi:hypothetical protein